MTIKNNHTNSPMGLILVIIPFFLLLLSVRGAWGQDHLTLSSYSGQAEISAPLSVTLRPGFHIPSGQNARIFVSGPLLSVPYNLGISANQNYISRKTFLKGFTTAPASPSTSDMVVDVDYYDGLGRPLQQVQVKGSPDFSDVVTPVTYDAFGRQELNYLPYAASSNNNGSYKANAVTAQSTFHASPPTGVNANSHPYSRTVYEASPLDRVLEQGFPGQAWQPAASRTATSGRTVTTEHSANNTVALTTLATTRMVPLYQTNLSAVGVPTLGRNGNYVANELYVTVSRDENWTSGRAGTVEEYRDKQDRVVLKRSFNNNSSGALEMLSTYYVYDDFGNLSFVLPAGAKADRSSGFPTVSEQDSFAYRYRYDGRNRMVEKKLPGKGVDGDEI